jgi:hypothetical protein
MSHRRSTKELSTALAVCATAHATSPDMNVGFAASASRYGLSRALVTAAAVVLISSVPIPGPPAAAAARSGSSSPALPPRSAAASNRESDCDGSGGEDGEGDGAASPAGAGMHAKDWPPRRRNRWGLRTRDTGSRRLGRTLQKRLELSTSIAAAPHRRAGGGGVVEWPWRLGSCLYCHLAGQRYTPVLSRDLRLVEASEGVGRLGVFPGTRSKQRGFRHILRRRFWDSRSRRRGHWTTNRRRTRAGSDREPFSFKLTRVFDFFFVAWRLARTSVHYLFLFLVRGTRLLINFLAGY